MTEITNPALKYYGGKFRLSEWIIRHFPAHESYVEPFGGGASVLLRKPPSALETYNDADGDVVNFFEALRELPEELLRQIFLTPWARDEFVTCLQGCSARIERARRLYFRLWMSRHGGTTAIPSNWRRNKNKRSPATDVRMDLLRSVAERLRRVQIENRDALQLIAEMDAPETLFYVDPPYPAATRTDKKRYAVELNTDEQHRQLADILRQVSGFVVLSGYISELYVELFELRGWKRVDKLTNANGGTRRVESLWLSPRTASALCV
jgi:DNA adenine methylase